MWTSHAVCILVSSMRPSSADRRVLGRPPWFLERARIPGWILGLWLAWVWGRGAEPAPINVSLLPGTPTEIVLRWSGPLGGSYRLESTPALDAVQWRWHSQAQLTEPAVSGGDDMNAKIFVDPSRSARYFRVVRLPPVDRGRLLGTERLKSYSVFSLFPVLLAAGINEFPNFGAQIYLVRYTTIDLDGLSVTASAALTLPSGTSRPIPLASYQHATTLVREDVPSRQNEELHAGLLLSGFGYACVLPDYLGLGDATNRLHPYLHAATEASASLDAIRAAKQFCAGQGIALNNQLFLLGYSQGGHATLALHRAIEAEHTNEFQITAAAVGAGPYDLSGTMTKELLATQPPRNPFYVAYVLAAYQSAYGLGETFADILRAPYDQTIPALFDGRQPGSAVSAVLPPRPIEILKPEILAAFTTDPGHPLRLALRDNDLTRWIPRSPLRLYHCRRDADVPAENSDVAFAAFRALGATNVARIDPFYLGDHKTCVPFVFISVRKWFDGFKK